MINISLLIFIIFPIIVPMTTHDDTPTTCVKINSSAVHCVPDQPSTTDNSMIEIVGILFIVVFGIAGFLILRMFH